MKRLAAILLLMVITASLLAACSGSKNNEDTIIIGIDDKFAPMGFRDEKNEIVGFDIDYAKAAADKMGKTVEFMPIDWKAKESELNSGRIDLIWNGYTITKERKEKVLFTKPYLKNSQVVMTLKDSELTTVNDLAGKVVGLQSLSSAADALNGHPVKEQIKSVTEYPDNVLALSDLKIGRTDAVVIDEVVAKYYMSQAKDTYKLMEESVAPEEYGVGVKQGNETLLNELQKALDDMNQDGTAAKISTQWFGEDKILK